MGQSIEEWTKKNFLKAVSLPQTLPGTFLNTLSHIELKMHVRETAYKIVHLAMLSDAQVRSKFLGLLNTVF